MNIYETVKNPVSWERLFFCKENMVLYTTLEVVKAFWQKAMDILDKEWKVHIAVNAQPLYNKFKKNGKRK